MQKVQKQVDEVKSILRDEGFRDYEVTANVTVDLIEIKREYPVYMNSALFDKIHRALDCKRLNFMITRFNAIHIHPVY